MRMFLTSLILCCAFVTVFNAAEGGAASDAPKRQDSAVDAARQRALEAKRVYDEHMRHEGQLGSAVDAARQGALEAQSVYDEYMRHEGQLRRTKLTQQRLLAKKKDRLLEERLLRERMAAYASAKRRWHEQHIDSLSYQTDARSQAIFEDTAYQFMLRDLEANFPEEVRAEREMMGQTEGSAEDADPYARTLPGLSERNRRDIDAARAAKDERMKRPAPTKSYAEAKTEMMKFIREGTKKRWTESQKKFDERVYRDVLDALEHKYPREVRAERVALGESKAHPLDRIGSSVS